MKIRFNTFIGGSTFNLDIPCTQASGNGLQMVGNLMKRTSAVLRHRLEPGAGHPQHLLGQRNLRLQLGSMSAQICRA